MISRCLVFRDAKPRGPRPAAVRRTVDPIREVNRPGACADPVAGLSTQAATGIRRSGLVLAFSLLITVWIATGTLVGALLSVLGMAVIAAFIPYYGLPIRGEIAGATPRRHAGDQA